MIMLGASYEYENFKAAIMFDNNPIYDDLEANYDGGLHRDPDVDPIAQSGNIGFGLGLDKIFGGKGDIIFDGMVTNLGEDDINSTGSTSYKISPVRTYLALKAGYPIIDPLYVELKAKYSIRQGDNADNTASAAWGKFEIEPYVRYQIIENLKFDLSVNITNYINSYYLALPVTPNISSPALKAGQVAPYPWAYDYYSSWQIILKPAFTYKYGGAAMILGYEGQYSRDHAKNSLYMDFRWSF
jgi:hypothetical protein